jgi:nucleoid DNA-binding protein
MSKDTFKDIVNKLAKKHNIPIMKAEVAANSQFSFIRSTIAKGNLESIILLKLGKILVKPKRKELLLKYNELRRKQIEAGEHPTGLGEFLMVQRRSREASKGESKSLQ